MKKILLVLTGLFSWYVGSSQVCFAPVVNYPANNGTNSVCTADFNNDGKPDLAAANWSSGDVSVLLGTGTGTFGSTSNIAIQNFPYAICSADFNNDGFADIATADRDSDRVSVLLGNGNGTFGTPSTFTVTTGPVGICAADLNKDGKTDIATAHHTSNDIAVMQGNGNGTFNAPVYMAIGTGTAPQNIISADFNGDTKPDLAVSNYYGSTVSVLFGNNTCNVATYTMNTYATGSGPNQVIAVDLNADNHPDLATGNYYNGNMSVLMNTGTGTFGTVTNYTVGSNCLSVAAGDYNGDGKPDLAAAEYIGGKVGVFVNTTATNSMTPTFAPKVFYTTGSGAYWAVSGDYDLNGRIDLAVANLGANNVSILLNGPPSASISGTLNICSTSGGTTLSGTSARSYTWSTGANTSTVSVNPGLGTTTYTLTEANGVCTSTAVATVTVTATPTLTITGNLNICSGGSTILTGGTASSYTWSPNAGSANTSTVSVSPGSTNTFTLSGSNGICSAQTTATVTVTPTPTVTISGAMAICSGNSTTLTGSSAGSYSWSSGATSQSMTVSPASTTGYTLTEANGTCVGSSVATVTVTATPTVTINGGSVLCLNNSEVLTGTGATTYTWSANAGSATTSTVSVNPTVSTTYSLTGGTPLQGGTGQCTATASKSVTVYTPAVPSICMVSADSLSTHNTIYWDKTGLARVDSFIIYREVSTNVYKRIGAVLKDSMSLFNDTTRHVGPANGNPNIGYYHYKLQIRDSCGNYSSLSPYHTSVYVNDLHNGSFTWNTYDVEGQLTPVANFVLRRDNTNTGNYQIVGTVSGSTTILNDPNYSTYQNTANWRVDATGFSCTPTMRYGNNHVQTTIVKSKSNISNNRTTHVNQAQTSVSVYPNPAGNELNIRVAGAPDAQASLQNLFGESVKNVSLSQSTTKIDLLGLAAGVYYVKITSGANLVKLEKIIVQH